jgi:hypothetical protein
MKNYSLQSRSGMNAVQFITIAMVALLAFSCESNPSSPSLYDPSNLSAKASPTITNISPATGALGGVTTLTITGTNFSAVKEENLLYFDSKLATITQATSTQLVLTAPNYPKDTIAVSVAVYQTPKMSNIVNYQIQAAFDQYGSLGAAEFPWAITTDAGGNLYVSFQSDSIRKYSPAGVRTGYASGGGATKWSAMKFGPDGSLYMLRIQRAIFVVPPGGGAPSIWTQIPGTSLYDLDFDTQGNMWVGGNNTSIYRIKSDLTVKSFVFDGNIRSIKVFKNYLYCGGTINADGSERVVRFPIVSADSLGPQQDVFNLTTSPLGGTGLSVLAVTGSSGGDVFVGTNAANPVILVHPTGSAEPLYPGVMSPAIHVFAWDKGTKLFAVQGIVSAGSVASSSKILRIQTLQTGLN